MSADVAPLVAAGVALIEDKRPGAVALLDPAEMRIASSCDCPLGQTFGSYAKGCRALRLDDFGAARHGFTWPSAGFGSGFSSHAFIAELEAEWVRVISKRRAALALAAGGGTP